MAVQKQEREAWREHPVTLEFLQHLQESRQETLELWAKQMFVGENGEETLARNAKALGGVEVLDQVIEKVKAMGEEV